jgi:hypothetical protein
MSLRARATICPHGHDKTVPGGANEYGRCTACARHADERRRDEKNAKRKVLKVRCQQGHIYTDGSFQIVYRTNKHGVRIPYRDCLHCRKARAGTRVSSQDNTARAVTIAQITEEILSIADQQDLAGGWERQQLRARVAELTRQKDQLERRGARKVAQ